jgi:YidC/Oxa1 family membrane protein insertase
MQQKRLILALVLSSAILFGWSYFYPVKPPQNNQSAATSSPTPTVNPATGQATPSGPTQPGSPASNSTTAVVNAAPQRAITIKTPLYEVKFDSQGAEPVSWIISKNKNSNRPISSVGAGHPPLQLISSEGLKRQPRQVPLQLVTGDANLDYLLATSSYRIEGVDSSSGDVQISLGPKDQKQISFVLDDPSGVKVTKTLLFDGDRYDTKLEVLVKRGDQVVPQVKLTIGPSIGDQGIGHYTLYSVAPEAVAYVNGRAERHNAASINANKTSPDRLTLGGPIDWAGVSDTYFSMVAIPAQRIEGLEYKTVAYEGTFNGKPDKRYLVTGLVPIPADGSANLLYAGPKDHYLLTSASSEISGVVQRPVDLEALIDYGWLSWLSRPLAVPILQCITWLFKLTGSYGVAIILFTIAVYSLFFPLKWRSSKAMKKAQKLAPQMKELQEKIKGMKQSDPRLKELQVEQLRLMKEGNPLGGCLPMLIQMPFLFALYRAITISLDFRQATFLWLPDLSSGDPYHILEILMAGTMIVLQLITPAPSADPMQRRMMAIGMPVIMLYVLWGAPSGLVVYWLVGNIVGFSQQFMINRWTKSDDEEPPAAKAGANGRKKTPPTLKTSQA